MSSGIKAVTVLKDGSAVITVDGVGIPIIVPAGHTVRLSEAGEKRRLSIEDENGAGMIIAEWIEVPGYEYE